MERKMEIIELLLDEENEVTGIEAVSIVEAPAIESDFVALKSQEIQLAKVDDEKKILMGAALIPNKPIYRKQGEKEYYVYFSADTVRKASELFFQNGNQNNATLEHKMQVNNLTVVESWIVENKEKDKSSLYGLDVPEGTWMISMKVNNNEIWNDFVKTGKVKGFSIEGYFADKAKLSAIDAEEQEALKKIEEIKNLFTKKTELQSFTDYPQAVSNNAKRGRELNEKVGNKCATDVGKMRSADLAAGRAVSVDTIKRMYSFLSRAGEYYDEGNTEACGTISYLLWGGKAALRWSKSKLKELGEIELASMVIDDQFAIIDDRLAYSTQEKAEEMARNIGCKGFHTHEFEGKTWYMPCEYHVKDDMYKHKCPKGYKKNKEGKCVKMAEVGPRGGIRKSPKAPAGSTPNPNPKGKGTAKGDAKTGRSAKVSKTDEATLQKKSDEFNERYKKKLGYGVTVGQLKAVYQRGLGAFNVSHSPKVRSAKQWALARVNAYLYLVKNGRPQNAGYTSDNDLLPAKHPKSPKNK